MIYEYIIKNSFDGKGTIDQIESLEPLPISENEGLYIKKEYYKIDSIEGFMYFKQPVLVYRHKRKHLLLKYYMYHLRT